MAEGGIGSVSVEVVPSAEHFWERFVEKTRPGALRAGEQVGAVLRDGIQAQLDRGVDVRVRADTGTARADIASVGSAADSSAASMSNLIKVGLALSPALIPIAAVGAAGLATIALGAKKATAEIKDGLTPEFHRLQHAAGAALTPGVEALVKALQQAGPELKQLVGVFGGAISDELTKFSNALSNGGLQSFINYAEKELPIVEDAFNSVLHLAGKLVVTLAPIGNAILVDITRVSDLASQVVDLGRQVDEVYNKIKNIPGGKNFDAIAKGNLPFALDGIGKGLGIVSSEFNSLFGTNAEGVISNDKLTASFKREQDEMANTAKALKELDDKIAAHINRRLASVQAENSFIVAARGVADAVKANGNSLDRATAAGQENRAALISAASAALAFYNAQRQAGVGAAEAADKLAGNVKQLELTAIHAGLSKGPVDALLKSMGLFPPTITTKFNVDITQALNALSAYNSVLSAIPGLGIAALPVAIAAAAAKAALTATGTSIAAGTGGVIPGTPGIATPTPPKAPTNPAATYGGALSSFLGSVTGQHGNPIQQAFNQLISSLQQSGAKLSDEFVSYLRGTDDQLKAAAKEHDQVAKQLERAQQRLANLVQSRTQTITSIRSATKGTFDIATSGQQGAPFGEPVTLFDIRSELAQDLRNAKRFEHALKQLAREGLSKHLVEQLAEAGPAALPEALALLGATPKQLRTINAQYSQLGQTGQSLGKFVGNDLFKAGIDAAEGLVKGLKSKERQLAAEMRHLAHIIVQELRSELDMHSPSRRLFAEGALAFEGYRLGIASKAADIAGTAGLVAGKALGNGPAYKFGGLAHHGGSLVNGDLHQHFEVPQAVPEPLSRSANAIARASRNMLGAR